MRTILVLLSGGGRCFGSGPERPRSLPSPSKTTGLRRAKVPANKRIQLTVVNDDPTPEEFESKEMKVEKVIPGRRA